MDDPNETYMAYCKIYKLQVRAVSFVRYLNTDEDDEQVKLLRLYFKFKPKDPTTQQRIDTKERDTVLATCGVLVFFKRNGQWIQREDADKLVVSINDIMVAMNTEQDIEIVFNSVIRDNLYQGQIVAPVKCEKCLNQ